MVRCDTYWKCWLGRHLCSENEPSCCHGEPVISDPTAEYILPEVSRVFVQVWWHKCKVLVKCSFVEGQENQWKIFINRENLEVKVLQKNQIIQVLWCLSIYGLAADIFRINTACFFPRRLNLCLSHLLWMCFCDDFCSTGEKNKKRSFHYFWNVSIIFPMDTHHKILARIKIHDSLLMETQSHVHYHI